MNGRGRRMSRGAGPIGHVLAVMLAALASTTHAAPAENEPRVTRAPELVEFVEAPYPDSEREAGEAASVVLRLKIDGEGRVVAATVVGSAGPAFDAAARAAALKFRFKPGERDGVPATVEIDYRYTFKLEQAAPVAPVTALLGGVVRHRGTGQPLAGVKVMLTSPRLTATLLATTDAGGRFRFGHVPAGEVTIILEGPEVPTIDIVETLEAGKQHDLLYEVGVVEEESQSDRKNRIEIEVVTPPLRREVVSTAVRAEEAAKVPGTSGDVLRVVESLPGVGRSAAGAGQLIVWGAAPQDTRIYVDGVPIPRLYHEGGLRSVVHPVLVDSLELVPGGYGAAYGRGLGGMVSISTRAPEGPRVRGRLAADTLDASAVVAVPLGKKVTLTTAVRGSYLKLWADRLLTPEARAFVPIPRYGDGQLRLSIRPSSSDHVDLVGMISVDRFQRGVPNADPALAVLERRELEFGRVYARWTRDREATTLTVTPYVGYTRARQVSRFGDLSTSLASAAVLAGLRINRRSQVTEWLSLDVGLDAEVTHTDLDRRGALALPPREGDVRVFGQPPPPQIGADRWQTTFVGLAPYAQAELSFGKGLIMILPGVRIDPYARSVSRRNPASAGAPAVGLFEEDVAVEPRLAISVKPTDRVSLRGATGLYRQMPAAEDLSATFGNPRLPTSRALHAVVGAGVKVTETLSLEVTGFYTRSRRLAMRSPDEAPLPAAALRAIGSGRAYGVQVMLRQEIFKNVFGWVAYTWMRAERRSSDEAGFRLSDYDQTHVLAAVLAYTLPRGFEVSGRFRFASGFPRTPVTGAYYDASRDLYQPIFGAHNTTRIPAFMQLDLRVGKRFKIARTSLDVFVEVLNLWNRKNAEELVYSPDYSRMGTIRGFPVLPAFGVQWDF